MQYFNNIIESAKLIIKNKKIIIPDIIGVLIYLALGIVFLKFNNFIFDLYNPESLKEIAINLLNHSPNMIKFFISLGIAVIVTSLFNLSISSLRYLLIRDALKNSKIGIIELYKNSNKYVLRILLIRMFMIIAYLIPASLIVFALFLLNINKDLLTISIFIISFIFIVLINSIFAFVYPALILSENKSPIKNSYLYFKKNIKKCFFTAIIIMLITYFFIALINLLSTYIGLTFYRFNPAVSKLVLVILFLKTFLQIPVKVWADVFAFKSYLKT